MTVLVDYRGTATPGPTDAGGGVVSDGSQAAAPYEVTGVDDMGSLGALARRWLEGRLARGEITEGTADNYRCHLGMFVGVVGRRKRASKLDRADIETWLEEIANLAVSTRHQRLTLISGFCEWLVDEGVLRSNPCRGIRLPKVPKRKPRALPRDAVASVMAVLPDARARLIVALMVQQGLRREEVAGLRIEDVDLQDGTVFVRGKGDHERILPLVSECREALVAYLAEFPCGAGPIVRSYQSGRALKPASIGNMVAKWMYRAGVKAAPRDGRSAHAFRHTAATDMLREGADVRDVQEMLGHTSLATTQIYLSVTAQRLRSVMEGRSYGAAAAAVAAVASVVDLGVS